MKHQILGIKIVFVQNREEKVNIRDPIAVEKAIVKCQYIDTINWFIHTHIKKNTLTLPHHVNIHSQICWISQYPSNKS